MFGRLLKRFRSPKREYVQQADDRQKQSSSQDRILPLKIEKMLENYQTVEMAAEILRPEGFDINRIFTGGVDSCHMMESGFHEEYRTLEEFRVNAEKDFAEQKTKVLGLNWNETVFEFRKKDVDFKIQIRVPKIKGEDTSPHAYLFFFGIDNLFEYDKVYAEKIRQKLEILEKENG